MFFRMDLMMLLAIVMCGHVSSHVCGSYVKVPTYIVERKESPYTFYTLESKRVTICLENMRQLDCNELKCHPFGVDFAGKFTTMVNVEESFDPGVDYRGDRHRPVQSILSRLREGHGSPFEDGKHVELPYLMKEAIQKTLYGKRKNKQTILIYGHDADEDGLPPSKRESNPTCHKLEKEQTDMSIPLNTVRKETVTFNLTVSEIPMAVTGCKVLSGQPKEFCIDEMKVNAAAIHHAGYTEVTTDVLIRDYLHKETKEETDEDEVDNAPHHYTGSGIKGFRGFDVRQLDESSGDIAN